MVGVGGGLSTHPLFRYDVLYLTKSNVKNVSNASKSDIFINQSKKLYIIYPSIYSPIVHFCNYIILSFYYSIYLYTYIFFYSIHLSIFQCILLSTYLYISRSAAGAECVPWGPSSQTCSQGPEKLHVPAGMLLRTEGRFLYAGTKEDTR